jgi:hypothetical protein
MKASVTFCGSVYLLAVALERRIALSLGHGHSHSGICKGKRDKRMKNTLESISTICTSEKNKITSESVSHLNPDVNCSRPPASVFVTFAPMPAAKENK